MWRLLFGSALLCGLLIVGGSAERNLLDPVIPHTAALRAVPVNARVFATSKRLRFVEGWSLRSGDPAFGGLSGLLVVPGGLLAVSDAGALVMIRFHAGRPARADFAPLPLGCGTGQDKHQRDTESLARAPDGTLWVGYEWRNAVCRIPADARQPPAVNMPVQMKPWPFTGGAEAMARTSEGGIVIVAERGQGATDTVPMLLFRNDPAHPGSRAAEYRYQPPNGYRPTDIAALTDGALLVLHRRFRMPFSFSTILSVVPAGGLAKATLVRARPLALFKSPGLHDNFEGVAIEDRDGRSYIWLVSDDNFSPAQSTYLLRFELLPRRAVRLPPFPPMPSSPARASAAARAG